jgi:CRP-like cAMP-binding protein
MLARQDTSQVLDSILQLRSSALFSKLAAASIAPLAYHARAVKFAPGSIVAHRAEISTQFCHILEGTVRSSTGEMRGIHEALGGLALFSGIGMPFEAVAENDVRGIVVPADAVFEALEDDSILLQHLIRGLAAQLLIERDKLGGERSVLAMSIAGPSAEEGRLDLVQRMLLIQRAQGLKRTAATALADAARNTTPFRTSKGEFLWRRGEDAHHAYLIISGTVSALYDDRSPIRLGPAIAIGGLEALASVPRRHDLISNEEVWGLKLSFSRTFEAFEDHFELATDVLATLAHEILKVLCPSCSA